ncbi:unnamed protein product, partial [Nippostrongylus brasiliensis]|uniref:Uncharacterized protein n=1 Tax=Nippostrongylus brasiliensis TaxID=27835 RepID=A0A0N4XGT7_NIPBR
MPNLGFQMFNGAPPLPPRTSSNPKVTFKGAQTWRESIGVFLSLLLCLSLFISIICLCVYYWRDRGVYEELIDYLDKTISISKINYNHLLGLYQLNDKEINALSEQRTVMHGASLHFYPCLIEGLFHAIEFQVFLGIGVLYCICEVHLFSFMLMPYAATLPNSTEQLLNHAIPHNPGGLMQMEQRLGCTFDHNLYAANQRRLNPRVSEIPKTTVPDISFDHFPEKPLRTAFSNNFVAIQLFVNIYIYLSSAAQALSTGVQIIHTGKFSKYIKYPFVSPSYPSIV